MRDLQGVFRLAIVSGSLLVVTLAVLPAQQPAPAPAGAAGQAQSPQDPQPQPQPPRFRTEANFVRVDVFPSRDGKPVEDMRADEFEVLENNTRQEVQTFEHVVISPAGPQSLRAEASSVRAAEQMAANPRNRVFVIFLDVPHVAVEGSHHIKEPLIRLIDRVLGPDDLVAVMTPEMSAQQITFGRKTEVIADMLRDKWTWGERHSILPMDEREIEYQRCYPDKAQEGLVAQLKARRRERMVLDALRDLVIYLGGVREERKALLTISEGWLLYRPDSSMTNLRVVDPRTGATEPVPGVEPVGVDERGKLRVGGRTQQGEPASQTACDRDRMHLAAIDNDDYFRSILDLANRYNATFYPIDPRGLAAFDYPLGPGQPVGIVADQASLRQRLDTLRTLAENTDGMAVINSNNLDAGLRRIADDLTSYYLLGYYSTNARLDGGYRRITVRVTRPGVSVRARRGYRAPTEEEVRTARAAADAPVPESTKTANAALATLSRIRTDQRFSLYAIAERAAPGGSLSGLWIAGEVTGSPQDFARGGTAAIELSGGATGSASATLKPGERTFLIKVPVQAGTGPVDVKARLSAEGATGEPMADAARVDPAATAPLLFRRGPSTGNRVQPAADLRFSRTERLHLELPITADAALGAGRILDRNGQALQVPLVVADKKDADGQRWLTADATLSPLGAGDYLLEVAFTAAGTERKVVTAIRVTR